MGSTGSKKVIPTPSAGGGEGAETKYLTPTGQLYSSCNWDLKTIRKLIVEKKLAPFYPGHAEKDSPDLDECPICFMFYAGGLNRTNCCRKGLCTECFLQIKKPGASLDDSICPFCNRARFTVVFRGPKSREERMKEEMEEQQVLQLQEKMRQEEIEQDLARQRQKELQQSDRSATTTTSSAQLGDGHVQGLRPSHDEVSRQSSSSSSSSSSFAAGTADAPRPHPQPSSSSTEQQQEGEGEGDGLEDLMLMEAIRLSLLDQKL